MQLKLALTCTFNISPWLLSTSREKVIPLLDLGKPQKKIKFFSPSSQWPGNEEKNFFLRLPLLWNVESWALVQNPILMFTKVFAKYVNYKIWLVHINPTFLFFYAIISNTLYSLTTNCRKYYVYNRHKKMLDIYEKKTRNSFKSKC